MERWLTEFVKLWVVIDPIGTLPVFLAVTAGLSAAAARRNAGPKVASRRAGVERFMAFGQSWWSRTVVTTRRVTP